MVSNVTSLTGHGLRDWLVQRVTAIAIGAYAIFLLAFFFSHPNLDYTQWQALFACTWMRVASSVVLLSVMLHAWVGIWTVTTDYVKQSCVRLSVQMFVALLLLSLFIWGLQIFWGIV